MRTAITTAITGRGMGVNVTTFQMPECTGIDCTTHARIPARWESTTSAMAGHRHPHTGIATRPLDRSWRDGLRESAVAANPRWRDNRLCVGRGQGLALACTHRDGRVPQQRTDHAPVENG